MFATGKSLRLWLRICIPRDRKLRKLLLLCILGLTLCKTMVILRVDRLGTQTATRIGRSLSLHGIVNQAQQYMAELVQKQTYFHDYDANVVDPTKRTPQRVIWNNTKLYYHKVLYSFNTEAPHRKVNVKKIRYPPLGLFGQVVMAYNKTEKITNDTAQLRDVIRIPPADFLCTETPSKRDREGIKIVLVTTMFFAGNQTFLMRNTIRNWAQLRPHGVQPVLYVTPSDTQPLGPSFVRLACTLGWDVFVVPESNSNGFPVLRTMVEDARQKYPAPMVGYANGDITFDSSLPVTLDFFLRHHRDFVTKKYHLISGMRRDLKLQPGRELFTLEDVADASKKEAVPHGALGGDYFFSTHDGFPWHAIPPFVVGRPYFDNWLLWWSMQHIGPTACLDATAAITAVHQEALGTKGGWRQRTVDMRYNVNMVPVFFTQHGNTDCISDKLTRLADTVFQVKRAPIQLLKNNSCSPNVREAPILFQGKL